MFDTNVAIYVEGIPGDNIILGTVNQQDESCVEVITESNATYKFYKDKDYVVQNEFHEFIKYYLFASPEEAEEYIQCQKKFVEIFNRMNCDFIELWRSGEVDRHLIEQMAKPLIMLDLKPLQWKKYNSIWHGSARDDNYVVTATIEQSSESEWCVTVSGTMNTNRSKHGFSMSFESYEDDLGKATSKALSFYHDIAYRFLEK